MNASSAKTFGIILAVAGDFASNEEMLAKLQAGSTGWDVFVPTNYTITTYVGENLIEQKGIINKVFEALKHFNLRMISYGGSRHSISILVSADDKKNALNSLNGIFTT